MILDDGLFVYGKVACTDVKNKKTVLLNEQIIQDCGTAAKDMPKFNPKYVRKFKFFAYSLWWLNWFWHFFRVGDKCLARILEGEELWWFRGECLRVNDLKAQLLLLDSGKTVTVTLENVRNFDPKCDFEPRTSICKVKSRFHVLSTFHHIRIDSNVCCLFFFVLSLQTFPSKMERLRQKIFTNYAKKWWFSRNLTSNKLNWPAKMNMWSNSRAFKRYNCFFFLFRCVNEFSFCVLSLKLETIEFTIQHDSLVLLINTLMYFINTYIDFLHY